MLNHITVTNNDKNQVVFGSDDRAITHFRTNATELAYKQFGGEFDFTVIKEKDLEIAFARKDNEKLFIFPEHHDTLGELTHREILDVLY